ncbi:MAG: NifU N-terminal domain-containing protein [Myxococcota bacterium]
MSMVMGILKLPFRAIRKIVRIVRGGSKERSQAAPPPAPRKAPRGPEEQPPWMRQTSDRGHSHDHDHGHSHDHGHRHDHAPTPATPAAPAPAPPKPAAKSDRTVQVFPEDTPNPNAYKFTVNQKVAPKAFSASTLDEADTDLARALMSIAGVTSIFGVNDFITVTKDESASWSSLIDAVTDAIKTHLN